MPSGLKPGGNVAYHLSDMLQVAQSIRTGRISPSTILRKLDTASRKNKLYFVFREVGYSNISGLMPNTT
jgi:TnpA family transposase